MTLDEAIIHLDASLADDEKWQGCGKCKEEHKQLRAWLFELKALRAIPKATDDGKEYEAFINDLLYLADTPSYTSFHSSAEREAICAGCTAKFCNERVDDAYWCMYEALTQSVRVIRELYAKPTNATEQLHLAQTPEPESPRPLTATDLENMDGQPVWVRYRAPSKPGKPWRVVAESGLVNTKSGVEQWAAENPVKTNRDALRETFPNLPHIQNETIILTEEFLNGEYKGGAK